MPGERLTWVGQPIAARYTLHAYGYAALSGAMVYAITSARVLLLGGTDPDSVRAYLPSQLQQLERIEHGGAWGDLILETAYVSDGDGGLGTERHGLLAIAGVRRVHGLVAALAASLPLAPATPHASFRQALLAPAVGAALPARLGQALRAELGAGEHLVWAAQPHPASYLKRGLRKWFFFIPWTLFSALICIMLAPAIWHRDIQGADLWLAAGVPLLLLAIGLGFLIQPLRMRKRALDVVHAITTERALSIDVSGPLAVLSYAPAGLVHARCGAASGESGDLLLGAVFERRTPLEHRLYRHGFMGIARVRHVERLIGHLRQAPAC
jgi:hypothetical protein